MDSLHIKKRIWIPISTLILGGIGYLLYTIIFTSNIPMTQPNVNYKRVLNLEIKNDTLVNYWNDSMKIESGRLVVKEDRTDENSNHIEIYFERVKTKTKNPLAPIIFLAGGPGSSSTRIGKTRYFYLFKELSKYADVILMDQRGAGQSIPNLSCRNFLETPTDITENVQEQILDDLIKKCKECADDFTKVGIKLNAYNSYESALDIEDLRNALDYDKITLYGYSYGTELAQFYIRQYENNVDKVILAGALAPDFGLKLPFEAQVQFEKMDSLIKLDKKLSKYIPNFLELAKNVHNELKNQPKFIQVPMQDAFDNDDIFEKGLGNIIAKFRPTWDMTLTDNHLQMMVAENIGTDSWINRYPSFYYKIKNKNYSEVGNGLRNFRRRRVPNALFFTANGHSRYSDERWNESIKQSNISIFSHFGLSYGRFPEVYNAFNAQKTQGMNAPVFGNTKILLIGGTLDGRTPLKLANEIAKRFPNNKRIIVENAGHNNLLDKEIMDGMILFLRDSLKNNVTITHQVEFDNPVPYQYLISDTITKTMKTEGITKAVKLYQDLYKEYNIVEDYIFEFKPEPLYKIADNLIENKKYDDAIELLKLTIMKYPNSYYAYIYLGAAYQKKGDVINAKRIVNKALELDFFNGNTYLLLNKLNNEK